MNARPSAAEARAEQIVRAARRLLCGIVASVALAESQAERRCVEHGGNTVGTAQKTQNPLQERASRKGTATMKLTTTTNVSVDSVMQGLGGPRESAGSD